MLTIATARGSFQFHRHEYVTVRIDVIQNKRQVKDWLWESKEGVGIKINPGDEILIDGEWLEVQAVSWNAAWDRENEAEHRYKSGLYPTPSERRLAKNC